MAGSLHVSGRLAQVWKPCTASPAFRQAAAAAWLPSRCIGNPRLDRPLHIAGHSLNILWGFSRVMCSCMSPSTGVRRSPKPRCIGNPPSRSVPRAQMPMHQPVRWKDDNILVPKHAGDPQVSILFYEVLPRSLELQERLKDVQVGRSGPCSSCCAGSAPRSGQAGGTSPAGGQRCAGSTLRGLGWASCNAGRSASGLLQLVQGPGAGWCTAPQCWQSYRGRDCAVSWVYTCMCMSQPGPCTAAGSTLAGPPEPSRTGRHQAAGSAQEPASQARSSMAVPGSLGGLGGPNKAKY